MSGEAEFERQQRARFLARAQSDLARLRAASSRLGADPAAIAEIERVAHGLAGAGGTFGFMEVSEQAEQVEILAEAGDAARLPPMLAALDRALVAALDTRP
jgi:HPt (histidine-containing phosphotransfer) domain-containing protein